MPKSSNGHPVKAVQLPLPFAHDAAPDNNGSSGMQHSQYRPFGVATDALHSSPLQSPSRAKSRSSKPLLFSSEQLLRSPSEARGSSTGFRGWGSTWDAQTSSLPLGIALLLQESHNASDDHCSPRVALDPLPFSKSRARHFVMERMSNVMTGSQSPSLISAKDLKSHETSESLAHSISAPTNRSEALLLADTFRVLREQLQRDVGVADLFQAAELHAEHGKIDGVWKLLDEEMRIAVSTMSELARQVRCECVERGDLLEQVGSIFQRVVSILHHCSSSCAKENRGSSKHLAEAANRERILQQEIDDLKGQLAEKEKVLLKFHSKVMDSGVSLAVSDSLSRSAKENFENARRLNPTFTLHCMVFLCTW